MIKAVILDFDDTLCLTEEICFNLENDALVEMGRQPMDREIHLKTWGTSLFEAIEVRSPGIDIDEFSKSYKKILERYIENGLFDKVPEENLDTLNKLTKMGKYLAVLTSRTTREAAHLIDGTHPLAKALHGFYHMDNTQFHKPDPRAFQEVLSENGFRPEECIYVGDSISDAKSSLGAKIKFVACLESGLRSRDDFRDLGVKYFVSNFTELPKLIEEIENEK